MSAQVCGKKYATPLPFIPCPHPSPHPSANCPGPMVTGLLDHVTLSANGSGAPGTQHRQAYCRKNISHCYYFLTYLLTFYIPTGNSCWKSVFSWKPDRWKQYSVETKPIASAMYLTCHSNIYYFFFFCVAINLHLFILYLYFYIRYISSEYECTFFGMKPSQK